MPQSDMGTVMYSLLESKVEIANAQRSLEAAMREAFRNQLTTNIGYPGGTERGAEVINDGRHWFWSADYRDHNRRLNWFGRMPTVGTSSLEISVEINTPYEGRNNQVGGFFGRDNDSGRIYFFHSARIGGGTKGVSKEPFLTWTGHRLVEVFDADGQPREGVLVMPVEGAGAARSAVLYVESIADFKQAVRAGKTSTPSFLAKLDRLKTFYGEAHGRRQGQRRSDIDYLSRHGEVVQSVHDWRQAAGLPSGHQLFNDVLVDLGVMTRDLQLVEVYEVKTSVDRQSIYTAIGQLFVHGDALYCRRVMVLPGQDKLAPDLDVALRRNGIELMRYDLTETAVVIQHQEPEQGR
jgi:hypothetical protein